jgi:uncharacterized protein YkwD
MRTALLACGAVICCCFVLACPPGAAQARSAGLDRTERKVVKLVNRIRARHGLKRLHACASLARAASNHTSDILRTDVLSHASSDGTPMATRVRRYTGAAWVGENVAAVWGGKGSAARKVVRMWMASPGHRAVLLSPTGRRIGVGKRVGKMGSVRRAVFTADLASRR